MRFIKQIFQNLAVVAIAACLALTVGNAVRPASALAASNIVPSSVAVFFQATIKSIDPATRQVTLVGPAGDTETVVAGPAVRLDLWKAGDTVNVKYYRSVAFVVSTPGQPVPKNQVSAVLARPVHAPGGLVITQTVVTGTVVGIDLSNDTVQLVNPAGGQVLTVEVTDPVRRAHLSLLKVGDKITAVVSEALAVTMTPAAK
jgi:Cu/Ag efflux protein CusF